MMQPNKQNSSQQFIDFLTSIEINFSCNGMQDNKKEETYLKLICGLSARFPEGFLDYLQRLVLDSLQELSACGLCCHEFLTLEKIIKSWRNDSVSEENQCPEVKEFYSKLEPLIADFNLLVAVPEVAKTSSSLYQERLAQDADKLVASIKKQKLAENVFHAIERVDKIKRRLVKHFTEGRFFTRVPYVWRPLVLFLKRIWYRLTLCFNRSLRDINLERVNYVAEKANKIKHELCKNYQTTQTIQQLMFDFHNCLIDRNAPLWRHRLQVGSNRPTHSIGVVSAVYTATSSLA